MQLGRYKALMMPRFKATQLPNIDGPHLPWTLNWRIMGCPMAALFSLRLPLACAKLNP